MSEQIFVSTFLPLYWIENYIDVDQCMYNFCCLMLYETCSLVFCHKFIWNFSHNFNILKVAEEKSKHIGQAMKWPRLRVSVVKLCTFILTYHIVSFVNLIWGICHTNNMYFKSPVLLKVSMLRIKSIILCKS